MGEEAPERIRSFPPIVDGNSRVLVLGTMPGAESLRMQRYYAYGRNDFWAIMLALFGGEQPPQEYDDRVRMLLQNGVAVWDVLHSCQRRTSADGDIRRAEPNDIPGLLAKYGGIHTVFFNGKGAERFFRRLVEPKITRPVGQIQLPSTSPAYAKPFAYKLAHWESIKNFL